MSHKLFSLEGFITWLEGQDPETSYIYDEPKDCLAARFCHACDQGYGGAEGYIIPGIPLNFSECKNFRTQLEWISCVANPSTYGAALELARKVTDGGINAR